MYEVAEYVSNVNHCSNVCIKYLYKGLKTFVEEKQSDVFQCLTDAVIKRAEEKWGELNWYFPTKNNFVPGHKSAHDYDSRKHYVWSKQRRHNEKQ